MILTLVACLHLETGEWCKGYQVFMDEPTCEAARERHFEGVDRMARHYRQRVSVKYTSCTPLETDKPLG